MDEYIKREDAIKAVCAGCNDRFSEEPCEPPDCEIWNAIKSIRAADVEPKNKYDLAVAEREANVKGFTETIKNIKSEVAREILEEIENASLSVGMCNVLYAVSRKIEELRDRYELTVHCKDCEYLIFSDCYGECSKAYKGIVSPDDSCGSGKKKHTGE